MHKVRVWKEKWDITMLNPWSGEDTNSLCKQVVHCTKAMAFLASSNECWAHIRNGMRID
jgi:hypothetical protein